MSIGWLDAMIDNPVIRVHHCATGPKKGDQAAKGHDTDAIRDTLFDFVATAPFMLWLPMVHDA